MSRETALAAGRAAAEQGMTTRCKVVSGTQLGEWDDSINKRRPGPEIYSYTGTCKVVADGSQPGLVEASGRPVVSIDPEIHFPVLASTGIRTGHIVRIISCADDPALVGREFQVLGLTAASHTTARRLRVKENT